MSNMKIVLASKEDIPTLNKLVHTCYRGPESFKGWTSEANIISGNRTTCERLSRDMSDPDISFLKGVDDSGEMIACCLTHRQDKRMHTGMLCVRPSLQGAGLGKQMMAAVENVAKEKNCTKIKIEVVSARTELIEWYQRLGFKPNGKSTPFPPPSIEVGIPKENLQLVLMEMEKPLL